MDELNLMAFVKVDLKGNETEVRFSVPKSVIEDSDIALVRSYVDRLYDVVSFRVSFDPRSFDRKIIVCLKGVSFDVRRFSHFLLSL